MKPPENSDLLIQTSVWRQTPELCVWLLSVLVLVVVVFGLVPSQFLTAPVISNRRRWREKCVCVCVNQCYISVTPVYFQPAEQLSKGDQR